MSRFAAEPSRACPGRLGITKTGEFSNGTFGEFTSGTHSHDLAAWIAKWGARYPKLVAWVEETIEETLTFYRLPRQHHRHLKSTNMLERLNEEIRRRTYVVRIFPNADACRRLVRALAVETHENWLEAHRYLNMNDLKEHKKIQLRQAASLQPTMTAFAELDAQNPSHAGRIALPPPSPSQKSGPERRATQCLCDRDVWNRLDIGLSSFRPYRWRSSVRYYEAMLERSTAKSPGRRRSRSPSEVRAGGWVFARSGLTSLKRPSIKWLETAFAEDVGGALLRL